MFVPAPVIAGLIAGAIIGLTSGSWVSFFFSMAAIAALLAAAMWFFADKIAAKLLKASPLSQQHPASIKLRNQIVDVCARAGVAEPDLYRVAGDGASIASFGHKNTNLVVTDALVDQLSVIELEAAVAREVSRIKIGQTQLDTLAVTFVTLPAKLIGSAGKRWLGAVRGGDCDAKIDLDAAALTRYPPGLARSLEKMAAGLPKINKAVRHLWAANHNEAREDGTFSLQERLGLLEEL